MVVRNGTGSAEDISVIVFGRTGRRLSIESERSEAAAHESVAVMVRLGEATATDAPCAAVTRGGAIFATLALQPDGVGIWRSTFRPDAVGDYALVAWVGGERPRRSASALVSVGTGSPRDEPTTAPPAKGD